MRKIILILVFSLLLGATAQAGVPKNGDQAPDFKVVSVDGEKFALSSLKGKVVLMGMFHICVPCMNQALEFEKVKKQLSAKGLVVIGINTHGDSPQDVKEYLAQFPSPISFTYYVDPGMSINEAYIQRDMPTVIIIDKDGIIRARTPAVGADQLIPFLTKLL